MPCLLIVSKARDEATHARLEEFLTWRLSDLRTLAPGVFVSATSLDFPYFERTESDGGTINGLPEGTKVYIVPAEGEPELLFESPPSVT
jgi:hypothetical protein